MGHKSATKGLRVLVSAPYGRDAEKIAAQLTDIYEVVVCPDLMTVSALLNDDVSAILLTEEALTAGLSTLKESLTLQPSWSDIPFVLLTAKRSGRTPAPEATRLQLFDLATNSVVLERPLGRASLLSAVASAVRSRQKQFEMRDRLEELRVSKAEVVAVANSIDQMIWRTLPDGYHDYYNDRWYEFTGMPYGSTDGKGWSNVFHPDDQSRAWARWSHSLATGEPYEIEYRLRHRSGDYRWVLGRALPIRNPSGEIVRWFGTCTDIHQNRLDSDHLRNTKIRLDLALDAGGIGVWEYDIASDIVEFDERIQYAVGNLTTAQAAFEKDILPLIHCDYQSMVSESLSATITDFVDLDVDFPIRRDLASGERWIAIAGRCLLDEHDRPRLIGTVMDITEDRRALAERDVLAQELSHRIKNIFSVVAGIINLSARVHPEAKEFAAQLRSRVAALGRAHNLVRVSGKSFEGTSPAGLHRLIGTLLEPYAADRELPLDITGDDFLVDDRAATPLALLFHELATNAAKYGALSTGDGRIEVTTRSEGNQALIEWNETGGPTLDEAPSRKGFGSTVTVLAVESQLGGSIDYGWNRTGLRCEIALPTSSLSR